MSGGWHDEWTPPETEEEKKAKETEARNETNKEFVHLLKEKETLKGALDEKEKELNAVKGRNYELLQKNEQLEKELAELKAGKKSEEKAKKAAAAERLAAGPPPLGASPRTGRKVLSKNAVKHANPRQKPKKGGMSKSAINLKSDATSMISRASAEVDKTALEKDTYTYYTEIAEKYPRLQISVLLTAEKKFIEADVNGDGTIDADELEKILETGSMMFTKQQVKDIVKEIDKDGSCDLDFMECLAVINKLHQNRSANLPSTLEQNKSTVCLIQ
ncbi:uncharacterized protein [Amphiura filiformis]|uniref:uncharacterized protein isoform X2 n=1 Tax=Amphiura filiformis TaxID=82378 RepID=UPI003B22788B